MILPQGEALYRIKGSLARQFEDRRTLTRWRVVAG